MTWKREADKLIERCFQLLAFATIQFLDLSKANEKMTKNYKQTPLKVIHPPVLKLLPFGQQF
jgi:hypothetical protein